MRNILKIVWIALRSFIIFLLLGYTINASVEHIEKDVIVHQFKKRGVYQKDISSDTIKYYKIKSNDASSLTFLSENNDSLPGANGDILVSVQQNTIHPMVNGIISFYAGGHAAYIPGEFSDFDHNITENKTIEATETNGISTTCTVFDRTDWQGDKFFTEVIGLRVKLTEKQKLEVKTQITSRLGDPYNQSFIFNTENSVYCSDLISKAYKKVGKNLNNDGFTTSIWDLIVSPDTYISYYHYFDNDGIKHIYYLG